MFTGLIEETGRIKSLSGSILTVQTGLWESSLQGDSIAVDGSCLTVVEKGNRTLSFHCSRETVSRTIIAEYHPGTEVNLERPLKLSDGLHGHLVTGHVDETVPVLKVERAGKDMTVWMSCSSGYAALLVEKGSVAVSGISLTIASLAQSRFAVVLIPETFRETTAGNWKPGVRVNVEYDVLGKYVKKQTDLFISEKRLRNYLEQ